MRCKIPSLLTHPSEQHWLAGALNLQVHEPFQKRLCGKTLIGIGPPKP